MNCKDCKFFADVNEDGDGYCRRHAPQPELLIESKFDATRSDIVGWPCLNESEWCGDFSANTFDFLTKPAPLPNSGGTAVFGGPGDFQYIEPEQKAEVSPMDFSEALKLLWKPW